MMQHLLAKMDANQAEMLAQMEAKMDINLKEIKEAIRTNQGKTDFNLKEIIAEMRAWQKEMTVCQETTEACLESKEPTSVEIRVCSCAGGGP
jgi:hypothetical protein